MCSSTQLEFNLKRMFFLETMLWIIHFSASPYKCFPAWWMGEGWLQIQTAPCLDRGWRQPTQTVLSLNSSSGSVLFRPEIQNLQQCKKERKLLGPDGASAPRRAPMFAPTRSDQPSRTPGFPRPAPTAPHSSQNLKTARKPSPFFPLYHNIIPHFLIKHILPPPDQ